MYSITINETEHSLEVDGFGIPYIDGLMWQDFLKTLSNKDTLWLAQKGMDIAVTDPERFNDLQERLEQ